MIEVMPLAQASKNEQLAAIAYYRFNDLKFKIHWDVLIEDMPLCKKTYMDFLFMLMHVMRGSRPLWGPDETLRVAQTIIAKSKKVKS